MDFDAVYSKDLKKHFCDQKKEKDLNRTKEDLDKIVKVEKITKIDKIQLIDKY